MRSLQKSARFIPFLFLLFLVTGCATVGAPAPETNLERLTYVEEAYGSALDTAIDLRDAGELSASQVETLTKIFDDYETGRGLALIAIDASDSGGFDSSLGIMSTALKALQTLVGGA